MINISNRVIEKLNNSIFSRLGGLANAVNFLGLDKINLLAAHPDEINLVTRGEHVIRLVYSNRSYYSVYDLDGYLQYKLENHHGIYGQHILDDLYLSTLTSGNLFYLQYEIDPNRYLDTLTEPNKILLMLYV